MPTSTKESRIVSEVNENLGISSSPVQPTPSDNIINLGAPVQTGGQKSLTEISSPPNSLEGGGKKVEKKVEKKEEKKVKKSKSSSDISKGKKEKGSKIISVFEDLDYREVLLNYRS